MDNRFQRFSAIEHGLILLCFAVCLAGALLLPVDQCPDEQARLLLTEWIVKTGTLPTGNEPEVMIPGWGYSYALYPYLSSMIGAVFVKVAMLFTSSDCVLLVAARMGSILSVTVCCCFCLRLGHKLFEKRFSAILFASVVCFLPQVMFLGMYQNNDALSLCAVSIMLYFFAEGYDSKWPVKSCVGLAVGFSLGLLSYYPVYGWILVGAMFCILSVLTDPEIPDKGRFIAKRAALAVGICLLLAGWFFLRNAFLHNGDFLGFVSEQRSRASMREQGHVLYDYVCYRSKGMSISQFLRFKDYEWIRMSAKSFIGVFGYMVYYLPSAQYVVFCSLFLFGLLTSFATLLRGRSHRRERFLMLVMTASVGINFALHFWQSYARDYQPQGRYIITVIFPLAYMLAYGIDKTFGTVVNPRPGKSAALHPAAALTVVWLALFAWACLGTMTKMLP
ncbi:MAG: DUF2142 domain-containing protein [Oscillospiraceae bacterium]|nr:DUF2142 domain-containing protein [Oscillospiraceae bacterium]